MFCHRAHRSTRRWREAIRHKLLRLRRPAWRAPRRLYRAASIRRVTWRPPGVIVTMCRFRSEARRTDCGRLPLSLCRHPHRALSGPGGSPVAIAIVRHQLVAGLDLWRQAVTIWRQGARGGTGSCRCCVPAPCASDRHGIPVDRSGAPPGGSWARIAAGVRYLCQRRGALIPAGSGLLCTTATSCVALVRLV